MAAGEADHLQHHQQPHDARIERLAEPGTVREDQVALQFLEPVVRDAGLGEQAEAGIDAIDGAAAVEDAADRRRRRLDRGPGASSSATGAPRQIARSSARVTEPGLSTRDWGVGTGDWSEMAILQTPVKAIEHSPSAGFAGSKAAAARPQL